MKTDSSKRREALGRGLSALLPTEVENEIIGSSEDNKERVFEIDIDLIKPNAFQPRRTFVKEEIEELSASISRLGVLQPLLLRKTGNTYEIIAGERRWRAAKNCKLKKVPAIIMDFDEEKRFEISLVENIQRADLNPIDEAFAYKTLIEKYSITQEEVAKRVGKSRTYITNSLRLLSLAEGLDALIIEKKLSVGHAKVLASLDEKKQISLADRIIKNDLSVRELEELIKEEKKSETKADKKKGSKSEYAEDYKKVEEELENLLSTRVKIKSSENKGEISIEFYGTDDFNRIYSLINRRKL